AWPTVWHWPERSDKSVEEAINRLEEQLKQLEITDPGVIAHVVGLRLWAVDSGLLPLTRDEVVKESKSYIDQLYKVGRLKPLSPHADLEFRHGGYGGLVIVQAGTKEHQEVVVH